MTVSCAQKHQDVRALCIRLEPDRHRQVRLAAAEAGLFVQERVCNALAKVVRPAFTERIDS